MIDICIQDLTYVAFLLLLLICRKDMHDRLHGRLSGYPKAGCPLAFNRLQSRIGGASQICNLKSGRPCACTQTAKARCYLGNNLPRL
jgi:hypothetical protein